MYFLGNCTMHCSFIKNSEIHLQCPKMQKKKFLKMITIEQLKDVKERTAALERYLDIENKLVQVEEEQLRTQAPGFLG